ncbi:MAG TPA: DUF4230 domain-containing protein [Bryobacteraceae bacterium]|jgi:hypothetical protein|nr:DUF4230 domain-containing protein [Bryobacteraceae bacterium]
MVKFVAFFSTLGLICILLLVVLYLVVFGHGSAIRTIDSAGIVKEVHQLNELVTVRYSIEKVVGMKEQKSPIGEESILLLVRGKVLAGIDLSQLTADDVVVSHRDTVRMRLPAPHIEEAFLDEKYTKVWDRSITWWTPWVTPDPDLEHKARMQALTDIKTEAVDMGIIADAQRNAETDIRSTLMAFGIKKVAFANGD